MNTIEYEFKLDEWVWTMDNNYIRQMKVTNIDITINKSIRGNERIQYTLTHKTPNTHSGIEIKKYSETVYNSKEELIASLSALADKYDDENSE